MSTSRCLGSSFSSAAQSSFVFRMGDLCRLGGDAVGMIFDGLARSATPSAFRKEVILHDRAQPGQHVCAGCERHYVRACAKQRVLNKIVGVVTVPAQRNGESAKPWHRRQHGCSDDWLKRDLFLVRRVARGSDGARLGIRGSCNWLHRRLDFNLPRDPCTSFVSRYAQAWLACFCWNFCLIAQIAVTA